MKKQASNVVLLFVTLLSIIVIGALCVILIVSKSGLENDNSNTNKNEENVKSEPDVKVANSPQDFIDYLNNYSSSNKDDYIVSYGKIKFKVSSNDNGKPGYYYDAYYDNNIIIHNKLYIGYLINGIKYYLFTDNSNIAFAMISEIGPVESKSMYSVNVFDTNGKVLLSEETRQLDKIEVIDNDINYYMSEKKDLDYRLENDDSFCQYLNDNYSDDDLVYEYKKYEYSNGNINIIDESKNSIKSYKEKSNCN